MLTKDVTTIAELCLFLAAWIAVRWIGGPTSGSAESDGGGWDGGDCGGDGGCD